MEYVSVNKRLARDKGWRLLLRLFKQAKQDREIDFDEERILRATDFNVLKLVKFIDEAWQDKHLSEEEILCITFLITKIRDDATSLAQYDEIISKQEQDMLDIIKVMVEEFLEIYRY